MKAGIAGALDRKETSEDDQEDTDYDSESDFDEMESDLAEMEYPRPQTFTQHATLSPQPVPLRKEPSIHCLRIVIFLCYVTSHAKMAAIQLEEVWLPNSYCLNPEQAWQ